MEIEDGSNAEPREHLEGQQPLVELRHGPMEAKQHEHETGHNKTDEFAAEVAAGETEVPAGEIVKVDETTPAKAPPFDSSLLALY